MKLIFFFISFLIPIFVVGQVRNYDTYSFHKHTYTLEGAYGYTGFQNSRDNENLSSLEHFDIGIKWMEGKVWGAKFSFAKDKTRVFRNEIESGCDYTRLSLEAICNLTNLISDISNRNRKLNVFIHAGGGYAFQKSTLLDGTDEMGNLVFGVSPQFSITKRLYFGLDLTGVANFSRHFDYNGTKVLNGSATSETGFMYNASLTVGYRYWLSNRTKRFKVEKTEKEAETKKPKIKTTENSEIKKIKVKVKKVDAKDIERKKQLLLKP